uniref:Large ribosomal subunit protein mL64 n=1 Tax=Poecilia mexicana TaxID=48701 RepID=A0A3B3XHM8_9TELE
MAASMLVQRTAALCGTLKGASLSKSILPVNCRCGFVLQTASYNPKRLWLNLRDPYIPDKDSDKTPEWQKTSRYDRKLFGRYGSASGVPPASLWPSSEELEKIIAEEKEWHPPLEVMLKKIEAREKEETEKRLANNQTLWSWKNQSALFMGEAHSGEHGQDAQDGGRLAEGKARGQAETEGGEGAESQAAGRGAGALRVQSGPPQPQVPGDGRRDREGREEETETAEAQTEGGAGCSAPCCSAPCCPALELEFSATHAVSF